MKNFDYFNVDAIKIERENVTNTTNSKYQSLYFPFSFLKDSEKIVSYLRVPNVQYSYLLFYL